MNISVPPDFASSEPDQRALIQDRDAWFYSLKVPNKQEKLFELEVLLKGLDCFFNLANQPLSQREGVVNRDFTNELRIIRNAVTRVVRLTRGLLSEEDNRGLHFQSYVESRLLNDYQRARWIDKALRQNTPQESLYVLCHSFINFQEVMQAMPGPVKNSYFLFYHLEQLISREIMSNRYFNPFRAAGFAPHYDVIKSQRFRRVVRSMPDPAIKRRLSLILLMLFKLLRYFSFVSPERKELSELKDTLLIFALVHSEARQLVDLLEREMPAAISESAGLSAEQKQALLDRLDALAYQLSLELDKIYGFEIKDAAQAGEVNQLRVGISRSRGILSNIFKQGIVHLGQVFDPSLEGKDVFPDFVSRLEESLKLRRDVWLFHKVIENLERLIEESAARGDSIPVMEGIKSLRNFIFYYQNISFQFVRCYDREEFQEFFNMVDSFTVTEAEGDEQRERFKQELHSFKMFLETTLANINNRAELRDLPFGAEEGERILSQFLG